MLCEWLTRKGIDEQEWVLILVLMEDALRVGHNDRLQRGSIVLILVLMEDALRAGGMDLLAHQKRVLILVLMEDALRDLQAKVPQT